VVEKGARAGISSADTRVVEGESRITEIARLLGGDPESDVSQAHARELLNAANDPPPPQPRASRKMARKR
jgi:DNA repair protein RecN (Recombination protein N)